MLAPLALVRFAPARHNHARDVLYFDVLPGSTLDVAQKPRVVSDKK